MKRLNRYLVSSVLKFLFLTELAGLVMFVTIEFFERIDVFTTSLHAFLFGLAYIALKTPYYFNLMLPLAFLISMLILITLMVRSNETIVIRTSGISTVSLMKPFVALSFGLIVLSFVVAEWIVPYTANAAEYIYKVRVKKEEPYVFLRNDKIWFKRDNVISNIDFFDAKTDRITGLTILELADNFTVKRRVDAPEGTWTGSQWRFVDVVERTFENDVMTSKKTHGELTGLIKEPPTALRAGGKNPEEMGYQELSRYIQRLKRDGHDVRRYLVDLYNKTAFPFINLIMVFVAFSVGFRYTKTKHVAKGILVGVCVGALYWFIHNASLSFGYADTFPPVFATWLSNALFFSVGVIGIVTLRT